MPEETPAAVPPAPPASAPGLAELFEQSLLALVRAPAVFAAASLRPAPSFGSALGLALASGTAALALGLGTNPAFLQRFPPAMIALMAAIALGLYTTILLLCAVLLYGLGRSLGGTGDFDRALQAAAAISLMTPLQVMCSWFPLVWALPALLAAWVAAGALEGLFRAKPFPTRAVCAVLAGTALGLQSAGRYFVERASERAAQAYALTQAAGAAVKENDDPARQVSAIQQQSAAPAATGTSGLDLLRAPEGETPPAGAVEAAPAPTTAGTADVRQQASAMLDSVAPMLDNPALTKNMSTQQKSDVKDLQALMKDLQAQMRPGAARLSAAEQAKRMAQIQQMTLRMMSAGMQPSPAPKNEVKK